MLSDVAYTPKTVRRRLRSAGILCQRTLKASRLSQHRTRKCFAGRERTLRLPDANVYGGVEVSVTLRPAPIVQPLGWWFNPFLRNNNMLQQDAACCV